MLLTMLGKKKKSLVGIHEEHEIQDEVVLTGHNNLMQHHVWDLTWCHQVDLRELMMKCQCKTRHVPFTHPSASESIPPDVPFGSVPPGDSAQTMSMRRITFKGPPNPLDRAEPPKRTRGDDDENCALLSAYH